LSSEEEIEISQLAFGGHHARKPNYTHKSYKVQNQKNYPKSQIPMSVLQSLASDTFDLIQAFLKGELYIEWTEPNPLNNEIKVRFFRRQPTAAASTEL
jgi:hypothetical protein